MPTGSPVAPPAPQGTGASTEGPRWLRAVTPGRLAIAVGLYLLGAWALFFAIDVANLGGLRDIVTSRSELPVWAHLFQQNGPIEWAQWVLLAATMVMAARLGGRLATLGERSDARFWTLLGVGTALMVVEDAGDPRLAMADYGESLLGIPGILVELVYFAALGSVLLYALLRYGRGPLGEIRTRRYLLAGFVAYGVSTLSSGTRHIGDWYSTVGDALFGPLVGDRLVAFELQGYSTGYWLLDFAVQESIELVGAAGLCAAALAATRRAR